MSLVLHPHSKQQRNAPRTHHILPLQAAGMGMAVAPKRNKKNGKKNKSKSKTTPFNANASLLRLEKKYDELSKQNAKALFDDNDDEDTVTRLSLRNTLLPHEPQSLLIADWVPSLNCVLHDPYKMPTK